MYGYNCNTILAYLALKIIEADGEGGGFYVYKYRLEMIVQNGSGSGNKCNCRYKDSAPWAESISCQ
jgi:hypothetical protein